MSRIALAFLVMGVGLFAQPDLLTQAPMLLAKCAPRYTDAARHAKLEGRVILYVQIYPDGRAHNIKVQRGLGLGLDAAAVSAVKQWRFSPGRRNGKPSIFPATIEVVFRLGDTAEPCRDGPSHDGPRPQVGHA